MKTLRKDMLNGVKNDMCAHKTEATGSGMFSFKAANKSGVILDLH